MSERLKDLEERRQAALNAGPERAVARQHEKGKMLARERIDYLLDDGSFHELDMLARHRAHDVGLDERPYTDGIITGWGHSRWAKSIRSQSRFHGFWWCTRRSFCRKNAQNYGPC